MGILVGGCHWAGRCWVGVDREGGFFGHGGLDIRPYITGMS